MDQAVDFIDEYIAKPDNPVGYVLAVNPEKVFVLRKDSFLKDFFEKGTLLVCDGIGMVKALRILYGVKITRVPGADLMQQLCCRAAEKGHKIFIYGATEDVNARACNELRKRYPGILIVGRDNGFVSKDDIPKLVEKINASQAQILFVAMGSPRQERWLADWSGQLQTVKICQGIGGTLDTIVGTVKRAPLSWQKWGLEWLYRLLKQPSRAARQINLLIFVWEVLMAKCKREQS
ncbi:MAG: WecB/TagA/CpsF family glycosyltransferase [Lentisphaerae bacterium]|nr:WecB/TagA/CpsF family glycosyltransferase [Lentisphaerota bacterium]